MITSHLAIISHIEITGPLNINSHLVLTNHLNIASHLVPYPQYTHLHKTDPRLDFHGAGQSVSLLQAYVFKDIHPRSRLQWPAELTGVCILRVKYKKGLQG